MLSFKKKYTKAYIPSLKFLDRTSVVFSIKGLGVTRARAGSSTPFVFAEFRSVNMVLFSSSKVEKSIEASPVVFDPKLLSGSRARLPPNGPVHIFSEYQLIMLLYIFDD